MPRSRYSNNAVIDGAFYGTWRNRALESSIEPDMLAGIETFDHYFSAGERLDHLAARFLGEDQYYWIIAVVNGISNPLDVAPGTKLKIPKDVRAVLDRLM